MKVLVQSIYACGHAGDVQVERVKTGAAKEYAKLFAGPCPECKEREVRDASHS